MKRFGWIKSIRTSKPVPFFLSCTDGVETEFQVSIPHGVIPEGELKVGASFLAEGKDSQSPRGTYEFLTDSIKIIGPSDDEYPIQPKEHSKDFLRTIPALRGRTRDFQATWKIRHLISQKIHTFLSSKDFCQYYAPIITTADCEGAGETFAVKTDWMDATLTVSAQLQGEVGMMSLGRAYTFGPCFRAEKSATKKHLSEFWMVEPEAAFFDLEQTMDLAEDMVRYVLDAAAIQGHAHLQTLKVDAPLLLGMSVAPWKRVRYKEIAEEFGVPYGKDISSEIEQKITLKYGPTFITHYPADLKPFYMKKTDGEAHCFDLIFPHFGELIGGSEREDDYETLKLEMEKSGLDMSKMQWYLDTRRWGSVPHAGFGLGLDRLVAFIVKADKIHDVIPFPVSY
jgi:asparaginyl-tRNA synthetase